MINIPHFNFKKITATDLPLLLQWFKKPHIQEWWPTPDEHQLIEKLKQRINSKDIFGYLVCLNNQPIGYIQYYYINPSHSWLPPLPKTTIGIDQFIGDQQYIGKGYGTQFIKQFIDQLHHLEPTITTIIVDPDPNNIAAIKCYENVGFTSVGTYDTPSEKVLLMRYDIINNS